MNNTFGGIISSLGQINTSAIILDILLTTLVSAALGVLITLFYAYLNRKKGFAVEFAVTTVSVCSVIALIIAVIGTNIASAFSLAGIMSIVRFRSLQQKTSDIAFLFLAMATGLTVGLGLYIPAFLFVVVIGVLLNVYALVSAKVRPAPRLIKISVPESTCIEGLFDDILTKYTAAYDLKRARLISAGTVMELSYTVTLRPGDSIDRLLSEIRERNSNFNVVLMYDADDAQ